MGVIVEFLGVQGTIPRRVIGFLVSAAQAPPTKTPHSILRYVEVEPVLLSSLPTTPGSPGTPWNNGGTLAIA
jgi:hypothetical protein